MSTSKRIQALQVVNKQYRNSNKLASRAALHAQFRTHPVGWHNWVFSHLQIPNKARILEVGCGPGYLWQEQSGDLPTDCKIYLTDLSQGMLMEAKRSLSDSDRFAFITADLSNLPCEDNLFDLVIANHMLYHLPSVPAALKEIHRVIKPRGCLYAATNGSHHLEEIHSWKARFGQAQDTQDWGTAIQTFNLENGEALLSRDFSDINLVPYPDRLVVTEVEPLIRYIDSYQEGELEPDLRKRLESFLRKELAAKGAIEITKETGLFTAVKR